MQELMVRLDSESRYSARLEAENADLRARTALPVRPVHMGTPPGLPDTNRESTTGDRPFMPPLTPEGVVSLAPSHADPNQDGGPPGGGPPRRPDDDDDDDSDDDHRRSKDKKKKKKDRRRKKSRGRRRRRSPSSSPSSSSSRRSSSSSSGGKPDKKAVKKLIKALTGASSSSKDEHDTGKPRVKEAEKIVFPASRTLRTIAIGD